MPPSSALSDIEFSPFSAERKGETLAMMKDFHEEMVPFGRGTFGVWGLEKFEERFPLPEGNDIFLVVSDGVTAGYSWLEIPEAGEGYVKTFYLRPAFRAKGLGRAMLAHAEEYFRERGCDHVALSALADNVPANEFYARNGFTLTSYRYRKDL